MKRITVVLLALLIAGFAAVSLLKRGRHDSTTTDSTAVDPRERQRIQQFWERYRLATDLRVQGKTAEAAAEYERALALDPRHEDALYYVGNMYFVLGRLSDAAQSWVRLVAVNPNSARAHSRLGDLYFCVQSERFFDLDRAESEYRRSLEIYKEETGPLLHLAQIALTRGDLDTAHRYLDAVTASNYTSVEAYYLSGYIAWKTRDSARTAEAMALATRYARPDTAVAHGPSEGDTESGSAPILAGGGRCAWFEPPIDLLAEADGGRTAPELFASYGRLDAFLTETRAKIAR